MRLSDFFTNYSDEQTCKAFFKSRRELYGISCEHYGSLHLSWNEKESRWRCRECNFATGLKQGTVCKIQI